MISFGLSVIIISSSCGKKYQKTENVCKGAAIAQWIRLCLLSSSPELESQAHRLHIYSQTLYYICHCDENMGLTHIFKKRLQVSQRILVDCFITVTSDSVVSMPMGIESKILVKLNRAGI